jgi:hypothetical protein
MIEYDAIPKFTGFPTYRVNINWNNLQSTISQYNLDIDPDFQRGHVWTLEQQVAYIEFRIRGGMSGRELYANNPGISSGADSPTVLVDGKQRITAVLAFMGNKVPVFGGNLYRDISNLPRNDAAVGFILCVNDLKTRAEVLRWYLELNTGGVAHTSEELGRVQALLEKETK